MWTYASWLSHLDVSVLLVRLALRLILVRLVLAIRLGRSSLLRRLLEGHVRTRARKEKLGQLPGGVEVSSTAGHGEDGRTCLLDETARDGTTSDSMSSSRASFFRAAMLGV